ncbi:MAG TPA: recombinase family protein [Gemmataceae bacterium]|nr:recombinase family protein [Gemmataceae bacterium]
MNGSSKIRPTHLSRLAVVYVRQSDPRQVQRHRESGFNQRALRERLLELGWRKNQIVIIDEDQGRTARHAVGRHGFQRLVADVSLRKIGIIAGYEVSRVSRNCADWHHLIELCGLFDTLVLDHDGIYNVRDFNDRLLLGLKGTISEAEIHSLQLRMDEGRLSKAKRGELVQHLPTGLVRDQEDQVSYDPDLSVQERIRLVFRKFQELGSAQKVLRYLVRNELKLPRRQTSGLYAGDVLWKAPTSAALLSILKNPAYAGAFAYGRRIVDPSRQIPDRRATGRIRQPRSSWLALVRDVYPAYITWAQYERIQETIRENQQKMAERLTRKQAIRPGAALLTGLVRCSLCGHAMQVSYKENRYQYVCNVMLTHYGKKTCQYLAGEPIDAKVVQEFFGVLQPATIDALERVSGRQAEHQQELVHHLEQEASRLEYAAKRAERQYNCVDPENRLIAATLETKWENALVEWEQAKSRLAETKAKAPEPVAIPDELRNAFAHVGHGLPEIWPQLSVEAKKQLLRTLVTGVNLRRDDEGIVQVRIVWRGGLVSETSVRLSVSTRRDTEIERRVVARIDQLANQGLRDEAIAECLNREGYLPCRGDRFTAPIVLKLRSRHRIRVGLGKLRQGQRPPGYTVGEMARLIGIDPSWISRKITRGQIELEKDVVYGCYLFPKTRAAIAQMRQLKNGEVRQVSFPKEHHDG